MLPKERIGPKEASDAIEDMSDPEKRLFNTTLEISSCLPALVRMFLRRAFRVSLSGSGIYILVGKNRKTAESISPGQFVQAIKSRCFPLSHAPPSFTIPST
jgi:hypothetical protein